MNHIICASFKPHSLLNPSLLTRSGRYITSAAMHKQQPTIESLFNSVKRINGRSETEEDESVRRSKKKRANVAVLESGTSQSDVLSVGNTRKQEDVSNGLEVGALNIRLFCFYIFVIMWLWVRVTVEVLSLTLLLYCLEAISV